MPTGEEWKQLAKYYGGIESESLDYGRSAYLSLSALGTDRIRAPMGGRRYVDGEYFNKKKYGYYWSSNDYSTLNAWYLFFNGKKDRLSVEYGLKDVGRSCRCVMEY